MFAGFNRPSTSAASSFKTPCHIDPFIRDAILETTSGDFWLIKRGGEDWPVVIGDEEIVLTFMKRKARPANARQANGDWSNATKFGGVDEDKRCYPAVFLGSYQITWAPARRLEPIDQDLGKAIYASTQNPVLKQAWKDASEHSKDGLEYCKLRIRQQDLGRAESKVSSIESKAAPKFKVPEKRKRKGTPTFKYPPGYAREDVDDEESEDLFLKPGEPKIKTENSKSMSSAEMDALCDEPDPSFGLSEGQQSKRSKTDTTGRFSTRPTTPLRDGVFGMRDTSIATARNSRAASKMPASKKAIDPDKVIIYVGNPHTRYSTKRSNLDISPLLKGLVAYHPDNGWYVMSPMLSALDPSDFLPIGQYLTRREYDPNILDDGTEFVRLEKELMGNERGAEVVRCGDMYITAQMLELPGLQDLAFRKLKALEKSEPHPAFAILTVVETIFDKANEDFKKYLVQYMADHYWDLVLAETIKVAEVMNENEELAQGVFGLLSGRAEVEVEVEGEGEVREEKKAIEKEGEMGISGEAKEQEAGKRKEQKTTTSSQDTPKDHSATKEDDTTKEGLVQTKEEMIKMAWRESDREATEEDRTKLMQEQPQFCEAYSPGARSSTQT